MGLVSLQELVSQLHFVLMHVIMLAIKAIMIGTFIAMVQQMLIFRHMAGQLMLHFLLALATMRMVVFSMSLVMMLMAMGMVGHLEGKGIAMTM